MIVYVVYLCALCVIVHGARLNANHQNVSQLKSFDAVEIGSAGLAYVNVSILLYSALYGCR